MKQKKLCEIDGIIYMSPGSAGDLLNYSVQKVTAACNGGRVENAIKDSSGKWIIPVNSRKPLELEQIRKILICLISMKNKPSNQNLDLAVNQIEALFEYLKNTGYIEEFSIVSSMFPYDVVLTEKGIRTATEGSAVDIDWINVIGILTNIISIATNIWSMTA